MKTIPGLAVFFLIAALLPWRAASAGTPYGGSAWAVPGTVQAENFDLGGQNVGYFNPGNSNPGGQYRDEGVGIEASGDSGGGYNIGWTTAGQWLNYTVNVANAGSYTAQIRVASQGAGGSFHLRVDGVAATPSLSVPDTGGWQNWRTVSSPITLSAGSHVIQLRMDSVGPGNSTGNFNWFAIGSAASMPDFGPNVVVFDPGMSASSIQSLVNNIFAIQERNQFGPDRYAILFKPGTYNVDVNVGFYTQVLGLGASPDEVNINGAVHAEADWFDGNATHNFWRAAENLAINPSGGVNRWAVSQAAPFRRMHVRGNLALDDNGWSSGGFLSDSRIDGQINSGGQQQWFTRNSQIGSWAGSNWNMVFAGVSGAPSGASWPNPPNTVMGSVPVIREKPFLTIDAQGRYSVFVPAIRNNSSGTSWGAGAAAGQSISLDAFHIAKAGVDTAASLNAALDQGKHLLLTPGIYRLNDSLRVNRANTVILGLGLATLIPQNGVNAMTVADVDGVKIAGLLFDAGTVNSQVLLEVGPGGSAANHSANPTSLHDLFFRIGGAAVGRASVSARINSNHVIADHLWLWRADHGTGWGWDVNTTVNGLVVNGNNVSAYGLFVEHFHRYQMLWNGNGGRVYFYQSEIPYDVPDQASWMNNGVNGYASYKVADSVTSHEAWGVGIYCFFNVNRTVKLFSAIEAPAAGLNGAMFHNMTTVSLGGGYGEITHVINQYGDSANAGKNVVRLVK